ncbi:MAG TPA: hypothetical protein PKM73_10855 [Verrucomicrobiota bacterium]|nr:hypothetical protein [Verrucomicrobiota bacterium]HNU52708.1 hypothetical protein [Verrucomicrobiota bacterium]
MLERRNNGFVESTLALGPQTPPVILVDDPAFGIKSGRFGFDVTAAPGELVVIEGSMDFLAWVPLQTSTAGTEPVHFSDPDTGAVGWRFYHARVGP